MCFLLHFQEKFEKGRLDADLFLQYDNQSEYLLADLAHRSHYHEGLRSFYVISFTLYISYYWW